MGLSRTALIVVGVLVVLAAIGWWRAIDRSSAVSALEKVKAGLDQEVVALKSEVADTSQKLADTSQKLDRHRARGSPRPKKPTASSKRSRTSSRRPPAA